MSSSGSYLGEIVWLLFIVSLHFFLELLVMVLSPTVIQWRGWVTFLVFLFSIHLVLDVYGSMVYAVVHASSMYLYLQLLSKIP